MLQLSPSPFLPSHSYKGKLTTSSAPQGSSQPWVPHGDSTYLHSGSLSCVATVGTHVNRVRLLELHGLTGAGVFVAAGAAGCAT